MTYSTVDREHPAYTQEPVSKLGETGGTVVYIFPDGDARVKKGKKKGGAVERKTASSIAIPQPPRSMNLKGSTHKIQNHGVPKPPSHMNRLAQPAPPSTIKTVGDRLVEAGMISATQLQVALYDQQMMQLCLGDILIARGWVDQNTLDSFSLA